MIVHLCSVMQMAKNNEAVLCIQEVCPFLHIKNKLKTLDKTPWTVAGNEAGNLLYSAHTEDIL